MQQRNFQRIKYFSIWMIGLFCTVLPSTVWAEGPPKPSAMANPLAQVLVVIIAVLLLAIALLAHVVLGAAEMKMKEFREKRKSATLVVIWILYLHYFRLYLSMAISCYTYRTFQPGRAGSSNEKSGR